MRKFMILPMAGLLALGIAAPAAAAPNVSNTSGSGQSIYGEWSSDGGSGYVSVGVDSVYGSYAEVYQESGAWVECAPGDEPPPKKGPIAYDTTPGDGAYGFVGTRTWGYGSDILLGLSRRLDSGRATGTIELNTQTVDECNGIYDDATAETGALDLRVTGTGSVASFRDKQFYKLPSEFNGHATYRGQERQATGSLVVGGSIDVGLDSAYMSQVSWSEHAKR
jgi:hypothetical protein